MRIARNYFVEAVDTITTDETLQILHEFLCIKKNREKKSLTK